MSKNQLPKDEILKLFAFVESKNVPYRDVQYEIVDHLASAMEDMKDRNPEWSYSKCLKETYSKFPITGFAMLQLEKEKALNKYWRNKMLPYIKEFFKLPKIILTISIFLIFQQLVSMLGVIDFTFAKSYIDNGLTSTLYIILGIQTFRRWKLTKRNGKADEYLCIKGFTKTYNFLFLLSFLTPFIIFQIKIMIGGYVVNFGGINSYIIALLLSVMLLCLYLKKYVFMDLLISNMEQKYKHLNMSHQNIYKAVKYYENNLEDSNHW